MGITREQHPLTDQRKQTFLKVLAETGSPSAAAHAATPWSTCPKGGIATFGQARKRDLVFSDGWERAMEAATAKVEAEVMRRAMTPTKRPVFSRGELKGYTEDYDNRLLLAVARRLNPDVWAEKKQVELSGQITHDHKHRHAVAVLSAQDILLLDDPADRESFMALVEKIADRKLELEAHDREPLEISN